MSISLKEVKKHRKAKSAWIVIHNDVYDVSKFLKEHPGGEEALLSVAGKDGTQAFEDVGHSEDARKMLKKYRIGSLPAEESIINVDPCAPRKGKSPAKERVEPAVSTIIVPPERRRPRKKPPPPPPPAKSWWWLYLLLALGVAGAGAFAYKKYAV